MLTKCESSHFQPEEGLLGTFSVIVQLRRLIVCSSNGDRFIDVDIHLIAAYEVYPVRAAAGEKGNFNY